jgi:hypothetical protein
MLDRLGDLAGIFERHVEVEEGDLPGAYLLLRL